MSLSIRRFLLANIVISVVVFIVLSLLAVFFLEPKEAIVAILLGYPCLGFLIWVIVKNSFGSLKKITDEVRQRAPNHLSPIELGSLPIEIKPIVEEWNKLFDRLKKAFDREKRFTASAAHELKTPLTALKTHAQIALNATDESERNTALNNLLLSVDRSAHLIQQLLTLSRVTHELASEPLRTINLVEEAKEIVGELASRALANKTEIELIAPNHPVNIQGHEAAIEILIQNLVKNAINYIPKNSFIRVEIEEAPRVVILKVIDNGPGISEDLREQVFEHFFRVVGNKNPGGGLGLAIVQEIVDLHHAVILLEEPVGGGLEVTVTFFNNSH